MDKKYDDTNRGTLFKADERRNDRSPEYTGKLNIDGKEYRLSAWIKESKTGKKYFSLSVSSGTAPKEKKVEPKPVQPLETVMMDDLDTLPF